MAFEDPQEITLDTVAISLPRVSIGPSEATYRNAEETIQMRISHQSGKGRKRRMVRLDQTVIAADPLTAENAEQKLGLYFVVDEPTWGFTDAQILSLFSALVVWLQPAEIGKLLGGES